MIRSGAIVGLVGACLAVVPIGGCRGCDDFAVAGLNVFVETSDGEPVCGATVVADDDGETFVLDESYCSYAGAWERPGEYVVTVSARGRTITRTVEVEMGACHVEGERLDVVLG